MDWYPMACASGGKDNAITEISACEKRAESRDALFQGKESAAVEANTITYNSEISACEKDADRQMQWHLRRSRPLPLATSEKVQATRKLP